MNAWLSSSRARCTWLLTFLSTNLELLPPADLRALKQQALAFSRPIVEPTLGARGVRPIHLQPPGPPPTAATLKDSKRALGDAQSDFRKGLHALRAGKPWRFEGPSGWVVERVGTAMSRHYEGSFAAAFAAEITDALALHWSDITQCDWRGCARWFLRESARQRFCTPRCEWHNRFTASQAPGRRW